MPSKLENWTNRVKVYNSSKDLKRGSLPSDSPPANPEIQEADQTVQRLQRWINRVKNSNSSKSNQTSEIQTCTSSAINQDINSQDQNRASRIDGAQYHPSQQVGNETTVWSKINFDGGDYEGEVQDGLPHGYGRIVWRTGTAYHGEFNQQQFHGRGCFFFENGNRFEGTFDSHKPVGQGVFSVKDRRFKVSYDGSKRLGDGASPTYLDDNPVPEVIGEQSRVHLTAISKGDKTQPFGMGDYRHCKAVDAKLALACPLRAHAPLRNPTELEGRIAVVQRGFCSLAKKARYCQAAGAVAMLVLGLDNDDKYRNVFQARIAHPRRRLVVLRARQVGEATGCTVG